MVTDSTCQGCLFDRGISCTCPDGPDLICLPFVAVFECRSWYSAVVAAEEILGEIEEMR